MKHFFRFSRFIEYGAEHVSDFSSNECSDDEFGGESDYE